MVLGNQSFKIQNKVNKKHLFTYTLATLFQIYFRKLSLYVIIF